MSVSVISAVLGCLLWGIIVLFTVVFKLCKEIDYYKKSSFFWRDRFYECERNSKLLSEKLTEYDKIFENIKSFMPF